MAQIINIPEDAVQHHINLELHKPNEHEVVHAIQYDTNAAYIVATVWNNGEQYKLTKDDTIAFVCTKPDGKGVNKEAGIDSEGRIVYLIHEQVTVKAGRFSADFRIFSTSDDGNGKIIAKSKSTTSFTMWVEKSSLQNETIVSSNEFDVLTKLITDATEAILNTNDVTNRANAAIVDINNAIDNVNVINLNIQNAEAIRADNEVNRVANENIREANEINRQQNETIRQQQESQRQAFISNAQTAINNANDAADRANTAAQNAEDLAESIISEKFGINDVNPTITEAYSGIKVEERLATKAQYGDVDSQSGTFIHTDKTEDSVVEIIKIEGKTTITPANPDEDISPDNVAEIKSVGDNPFDVVSANENLLNIKTISSKTHNGVTYTIQEDGGLKIVGTATAYSYLTIPISLPYGIYTKRNNAFSGVITTAMGYGTNFRTATDAAIDGTYNDCTVTTEPKYLRVYVNAGVAVNDTFYIQVQVGSTATDYTPHQSDKITLDVPLRENDELIYLGNGKAKYLKGDQQVVFDGSSDEDWKKSSTEDYVYFIDIPEALVLGEVLCSHYKVVANSNIAKNNRPSLYNSVYQGVMRIFIFETEDVVDLSTFKNKLQSNPIIIQYQLATPIETIIDLPTLKSYAGITNIYTTSEVQPVITANFKSRLWNDMRSKFTLVDGEIPEEYLPHYDVKDNTISFDEATEDKDIESGLKLSTIFGRLVKNIKSLRNNKIDKANIANNSVTTEEGMVLDARQGKELQDQITQLNNNLALVSGGSYAADANAITPLVFQVIPYNASTLNTPYKAGITTKQGGIIFSFCTSANYGIQLAIPISDKQIFMRGLSGGTWNAWETKIT